MAIRSILTESDPALKKRSRPVKEINDRIREQIADMAETMYAAGNGIGLAAPQVGLLKRMFVIDMQDGAGLRVFINPEIVEAEGEQCGEEGCLSIPGVYGSVRRPARLRVKAQNLEGEYFELEAEALLAVCICHENDHLDGILFTDKVIGELTRVQA